MTEAETIRRQRGAEKRRNLLQEQLEKRICSYLIR